MDNKDEKIKIGSNEEPRTKSPGSLPQQPQSQPPNQSKNNTPFMPNQNQTPPDEKTMARQAAVKKGLDAAETGLSTAIPAGKAYQAAKRVPGVGKATEAIKEGVAKGVAELPNKIKRKPMLPQVPQTQVEVRQEVDEFGEYEEYEEVSTPTESEIETEVSFFKKNIGVILPIAFFFTLIGVVLFFLTVIFTSFNSLSSLFQINVTLNNLKNEAAEFGEKIGNMFTGCGWSTDEECNAKTKFFDEVEKVKSNYLTTWGVQLNTNLITQTLTNDVGIDFNQYDETDYSQFTSDEMFSLGNSKGDDDVYKDGKKMIWVLADNMAPIKEREVCQTDEDGEETCWMEEYRELDLDAYEDYLKSEFIEKYYYPDYSEDDIKSKVNRTYNEIIMKIDYYEGYIDSFDNGLDAGRISAVCPSVKVIQSNGSIEEIGLEEYIARVISKEMGEFPPEALKAQAIAARTYLLNRTNFCAQPIANSDTAQTVKDSAYQSSIIAANETAGMVMLYEGEIFSAQYDSFCYADSNCVSGRNSDGTYYSIYTKAPSNEQHTITLTDSRTYGYILTAAGHANGMSQLYAYQLAQEGKTYDEILKFFYADGIEIAVMSGGGIPLDEKYMRVTSDFGPRIHPISGKSSFHGGVDYGAPGGANIYSIAPGVVVTATYNSSYGNYVEIGHGELGDNGLYEFYTLGAHMSKLLVRAGDVVNGGDVVGLVGTTGSSTGNHLHFEYKTTINGTKERIDFEEVRNQGTS